MPPTVRPARPAHGSSAQRRFASNATPTRPHRSRALAGHALPIRLGATSAEQDEPQAARPPPRQTTMPHVRTRSTTRRAVVIERPRNDALLCERDTRSRTHRAVDRPRGPLAKRQPAIITSNTRRRPSRVVMAFNMRSGTFEFCPLSGVLLRRTIAPGRQVRMRRKPQLRVRFAGSRIVVVRQSPTGHKLTRTNGADSRPRGLCVSLERSGGSPAVAGGRRRGGRS